MPGLENAIETFPKDKNAPEMETIKNDSINIETKNVIGSDRFENLEKSTEQLDQALKALVYQSQTENPEHAVELEALIRKISNKMFGHAVSENGKPARVVNALKQFEENL